ncbi:tetratricopeptide repeat protein [Pseudoduganella lurida]|uniref:Tetratricopeptide repeat protein n=1 Tax=Pseudoduganella lurida TaxID=1036180 RepID=A0A562RJ66_9BURK|nr:response regulator [Pseudoduganella lurida]TWI68983.1 tetratricopeptide repeat protein [Pseudoduganella lurida]
MPSQPALSDLSVLIVDPNPGMRGSLHNMLAGASITQIDYALSSGTAIRQLGRRNFDLILCEYDLDAGGENGQDGQQLLEDLRHHRLIDAATIFIMLTSEGVDSKVMGAAELTPTDYVLKPFTADGLLQRISRAFERRIVMLPAWRQLAAGNLRDTVRLCRAGVTGTPRLAADFLRLEAECHAALGDWASAERMYRDLLAARPAGWAQLGLARCQYAQGRIEDARHGLELLIDTNPRFMAAYDLLARTYEAAGQPEQARRVLENAVTISPHMVRRLRRLGELALDTGDVGGAERAFRQVVTKAKYSEFRDPQDHVNLVRTLVRKGNAAQASGIVREMERTLRNNPETDACRAIAAALVQEMAGNDGGAVAELSKAVAATQMAQGLSGRTRRELVHSCLQYKLDDDASTVVLGMMNDPADPMTMAQAVGLFEAAGRHDLAAGVSRLIGQRVDTLIADVRTLLHQLDEGGWEVPLADRASHLLARLRTLDPANDALPNLSQQYLHTQRKYGIAAA